MAYFKVPSSLSFREVVKNVKIRFCELQYYELILQGALQIRRRENQET